MPQSENNMNTIDGFFRNQLKSSKVKPPSAIWNNIEREILLKEREKEKRKIVLLRWSVAASIAMFFTLGAYMWVISTENIELKHETALRNNNVQSGPNEIKQLDTKKKNHETGKLIVEHTGGSPVAKAIVDFDYQVRSQESIPALPKSARQLSAPLGKDSSQKETLSEFGEEVKKIDKNNSIDQVSQALTKNVLELPIQSQTKTDTAININTNSLAADYNEVKAHSDSLSNPPSSITAEFKDQNKVEKSNPTWWIGGAYSPDYTYQNFSVASGNSNAANMKNSYVNASDPKYAYTAGLQAGYQLNKKWSIQTGFLYADKGEMTDYRLIDTLAVGSMMTTTATQNAYYTVNQNYIVNYKYEYFDVPLLIKYQLGTGRLNYCVSTGFSANFFFRYQTVSRSIDNGDKQTTRENPAPFKSINYSVIVSAGINYFPSAYSKRISVSLEPTFRHAFTSTVKNSIINTYPYSLGLVAGLKYHI